MPVGFAMSPEYSETSPLISMRNNVTGGSSPLQSVTANLPPFVSGTTASTRRGPSATICAGTSPTSTAHFDDSRVSKPVQSIMISPPAIAYGGSIPIIFAACPIKVVHHNLQSQKGTKEVTI